MPPDRLARLAAGTLPEADIRELDAITFKETGRSLFESFSRDLVLRLPQWEFLLQIDLERAWEAAGKGPPPTPDERAEADRILSALGFPR